LLSISEYVKNIKKIEARTTDLLADIVSDMKSNMTFLAPLLAGIIIGLSTMITSILLTLKKFTSNVVGQEGIVGSLPKGLLGMIDIFKIEEMIPPYWLQIIIGIYLIEIIFILTMTLISIRYGKDDLKKTYDTATNLQYGIITYFLISLMSILILALVASIVLRGII
ncbi:MAG: hypothetical protein QW103_03045, partial [Candidatus Pacearchaeota archaeon]